MCPAVAARAVSRASWQSGPAGGPGQRRGKRRVPCDSPMADLLLGSLRVVALSLFKHRYSASFQPCPLLSGNLWGHELFPQRLSARGGFHLLLAAGSSSKARVSWEQILLQPPFSLGAFSTKSCFSDMLYAPN